MTDQTFSPESADPRAGSEDFKVVAVSSIGTPPWAFCLGTGCTKVSILPYTWTGRFPRIHSN